MDVELPEINLERHISYYERPEIGPVPAIDVQMLCQKNRYCKCIQRKKLCHNLSRNSPFKDDECHGTVESLIRSFSAFRR